MPTAHFRVDPRLTQVLSENYTSSEKALKELIDNAWDGRKGRNQNHEGRVKAQQQALAKLHHSSFKLHPSPRRLVKGRKGIGKFAGLILASEMELITQAAGKRTRVVIDKIILMQAPEDAESRAERDRLADKPARRGRARARIKIPLPLEVTDSTNKVERKNDQGIKRSQRPHQAVCTANYTLVWQPAEDDRGTSPWKAIAAFGNLRWSELQGGASWPQQSGVHCQTWGLTPRDRRVRLLAGTPLRFRHRPVRKTRLTTGREQPTHCHLHHHHQERTSQPMRASHFIAQTVPFLHSSFCLQTLADNCQLKTIIEDYIGPDAKDRPDLFLAGNVFKKHLLIEFKKPTLTVGRDAEFQAKKYADTLTGKLGLSLDILIIGGTVDAKMVEEYSGKRTTFVSYRAVIALARTQLQWLLAELAASPIR